MNRTETAPPVQELNSSEESDKLKLLVSWSEVSSHGPPYEAESVWTENFEKELNRSTLETLSLHSAISAKSRARSKMKCNSASKSSFLSIRGKAKEPKEPRDRGASAPLTDHLIQIFSRGVDATGHSFLTDKECSFVRSLLVAKYRLSEIEAEHIVSGRQPLSVTAAVPLPFRRRLSEMRAFSFSRIVKKMKKEFGGWPVPPETRDQLFTDHFFSGPGPDCPPPHLTKKCNLTTIAECLTSKPFRAEALTYLSSESFVLDYRESLPSKVEKFLERLRARLGSTEYDSVSIPMLRMVLKNTPFPWTTGEVEAARDYMIRLISDDHQLTL